MPPGASGPMSMSAPRVPDTGSNSRSTGVRRPPSLRIESSTRLGFPAYTRGGLMSRPTARRRRAMATNVTANATTPNAPAPSTNSSRTPKIRPPRQRTNPPTRTNQPCLVSMPGGALPRRAPGGDGHRLHDLAKRVGRSVAGQLGFGRHDQAVGEHGFGERLDVVGHDVAAAGGRGARLGGALQVQ